MVRREGGLKLLNTADSPISLYQVKAPLTRRRTETYKKAQTSIICPG